MQVFLTIAFEFVLTSPLKLMTNSDTLAEIRSIVGDDIPESLYKQVLFSWKLYTKREPVQPFLVCRHEAFDRLCQHAGFTPAYVKTTVKGEPFAAFELSSFQPRRSRGRSL